MTANLERVVAGVGCATAATSNEVIGLVEACLAQAGFSAGQLVAIGSHVRKEYSPQLAAAAVHFDVPLRFLDDDDLPFSVAEGVAAAAGPLRLGKHKTRYATCALAVCDADFDLAAFGQPPRFSASIAASTLATSSAGP